jgi:hypothetical protein
MRGVRPAGQSAETGPILLITGTRRGRADVWEWLDLFTARRGRPAWVFVGDEPKGVDEQARNWCRARGVVCFTAAAVWDVRGKVAGPERNTALVQVVVKLAPGAVCLAFPDEKSVGTHDCADKAKAAGLETHKLELRKPRAA